MLIRITNCTYEDVADALDLIDDCEWAAEDEGPRIDPAWSLLPKPGSQRQAVLLAFYKTDHLYGCRDRIKRLAGIDSEGTTRFYELMMGGWIEETGGIERTEAGEWAAVLRLTEKAHKEINRAPKAWFPGGVRV
jgi:hypothetical protein